LATEFGPPCLEPFYYCRNLTNLTLEI
jgi:hypothetical protein